MNLRIASVPEDVEIVAIGDVHGRADLLKALVEYFEIGAELDSDEKFAFVFLGDLIDRGPQSREAIEIALDASGRHPGSVIIKGNHEEFMLDVAYGSSPGFAWDSWYYEGGAQTLRSLGIESRQHVDEIALAVRTHETIRRLVDASVDAACDSKRIYVHAGIRPHVPFNEQRDYDLRWIRNDFLESRTDHGRIVVHGHTITQFELPEVRRNRIAIDTGAFISGRLTAAWFKPDGRSGFVMAEGARRDEEETPIRVGPVEPTEAD